MGSQEAKQGGRAMIRVLVVDDGPANRQVLCKLLEPFAVCDTAEDGEEAVEKVFAAYEEDRPYDLVCLDIEMPKKNGQETLEEIRRIEDDRGILLGDGVRVLMTTSVSSPKRIMQAFKEQCDGYLVKPVQKDKLLKQLHLLGIEVPS
jgi:two-component system, chemotaxis family, chemotaxis protein CheY